MALVISVYRRIRHMVDIGIFVFWRTISSCVHPHIEKMFDIAEKVYLNEKLDKW